jgi:glycosyltransferase involved in cell wall biosynthesis
MYPSKQKPYSGLFVVNQLNELKKNDQCEIDFFYMERKFTGKIGSLIKYFTFFARFLAQAIKWRMSSNKHEIIHVHYYYPTIYLALIYKAIVNANVKIVVTFHGFDLYRTKKNIFFRFPFKYVDAVIGVSDGICKGVKPFYSGNIYDIPAGINNCFDHSANKSEINYDFIFVGSFYIEKGFDRLAKFIKSCDPSIRFCIVGSGNLLDEFSELNHYNNVDIFKNLAQKKIVSLLYTSKYLLNLSREESFGLSMTEAMACGIPVIATETDGSLAQILNDENGYIIPNNTLQLQLNEEILKIFETTRKIDYELLTQAALQSSAKYKLQNVVNEVQDVYLNVLKEL